MCVSVLSTTLFETFLILRIIERDNTVIYLVNNTTYTGKILKIWRHVSVQLNHHQDKYRIQYWYIQRDMSVVEPFQCGRL